MSKKTLGYVISSSRKKRQLSQKQLAEKIMREDGDPISPQYLNDIEHNRLNPSSNHIIKQFSKILRIKADDLLDLSKVSPETTRKKKLAFQSFEKTYSKSIITNI